MKRPRRTASNFSETVQQHLNMYSLTASAAGVSLLALAQPAERPDRLQADLRWTAMRNLSASWSPGETCDADLRAKESKRVRTLQHLERP